jgi:hypothetical protein
MNEENTALESVCMLWICVYKRVRRVPLLVLDIRLDGTSDAKSKNIHYKKKVKLSL